MKRRVETICIAVPIDDGARPEFWTSLINFIITADTVLPDRLSIALKTNIGDSLITRARNNLVHEAAQADYILFLDTDLDFAPGALGRLISRRREDSVVCGPYAIKEAGLRYCYNPIVGEKPDRDGMLKVRESGTGCMLIPRKILKTIRAKWPALEYTDDIFRDKRFSFFDVGVVNGRYLSEDWLFCRRVYQAGFTVLVDTGITLGHHGWSRYPLKDEFLLDAVSGRANTTQQLTHWLRGIDKAARERWTKRRPASSTRRLKSYKASLAKPSQLTR